MIVTDSERVLEDFLLSQGIATYCERGSDGTLLVVIPMHREREVFKALRTNPKMYLDLFRRDTEASVRTVLYFLAHHQFADVLVGHDLLVATNIRNIDKPTEHSLTSGVEPDHAC